MTKNKGGRPKKDIDFDELQKLCNMHCTQDEICDFFDVDDKTLTARLTEAGYDGFSDFYKKHLGVGKISIRRMQWASAKKGSVAMQVWLGKQYLGQREKIENSENQEVPQINVRIVNPGELKKDVC